jgi:hypothetical protein
MRTTARLAILAGVALVAGCDVDQSFAFPNAVEGVPGVVHLGELLAVPAPDDESAVDEVAAYYNDYVIYGEVGPTGTPEYGGVSFDFKGNGGDICIWVDPESVGWNQSVSPTSPNEAFAWPDNLFDDGDLDIKAGLSVYYTGTPGQRIGTFEVLYEDAIGVTVPITLFECTITSDYFSGGPSYAGRATAEFCTIANTIENVSYTVLLESFSLPQDDDRLGYGLLVLEGSCDSFLTRYQTSAENLLIQECIITGESIKPGAAQGEDAAAAGLPSPSWIGLERPAWEDSELFEAAFCGSLEEETIRSLCRDEARVTAAGGPACSEHDDPQSSEEVRRCFCGDILDSPTAGAF